MFEQEKRKKVGFFIEPSKWERFKQVARLNNSDTSKELRKFVDRYLSEHAQLTLNTRLKGDE